jgi:hypothetical protein
MEKRLTKVCEGKDRYDIYIYEGQYIVYHRAGEGGLGMGVVKEIYIDEDVDSDKEYDKYVYIVENVNGKLIDKRGDEVVGRLDAPAGNLFT